MHLGRSSCVYPLEADDFAAVPDSDGEPTPDADLPDDAVSLLLRKDSPDCLPRALSRLARLPARADAFRNCGFRLSSLAARVEDAFGVKVVSLKGLPGRSHSLNYRVSTADGAVFSVKLTPSWHGEKRSRLLAHARSVRCPLVAGLAFPAADVAFERFQILCFQWKDGRSRAFDKLSAAELSDLLAAHRAFLAGLSDDGYVLPAYDLAAARAGLLERVAGGTAHGIRRELESLDAATFRRAPERTCVIHGDLNPDNVLFCDGKVSGVLDVEELRFGVPAEDLVRFVVCGAEHLKFYQFGRLRRFVRHFEALVRVAGVPAEDWLLAINGALLRKLQRHVRGPRVPFLTRVRLQFRFRFYRSLRDVVRRIAAGGEGGRACSV